MKILVDTSVWSIDLRHTILEEKSEEIKEQLFRLIDDYRVAIIGAIRQELLSGIKSESQFNLLKKRLEPFRDTTLETEDYVLAAKYFNRCRSEGIQGSHIDFLICAVSTRRKFPIYTTEQDFFYYQKHLDFLLFAEF